MNVNEAITDLSLNLRAALEAGQIDLAEKMQLKIDQLIEYTTKIRA